MATSKKFIWIFHTKIEVTIYTFSVVKCESLFDVLRIISGTVSNIIWMAILSSTLIYVIFIVGDLLTCIKWLLSHTVYNTQSHISSSFGFHSNILKVIYFYNLLIYYNVNIERASSLCDYILIFMNTHIVNLQSMNKIYAKFSVLLFALVQVSHWYIQPEMSWENVVAILTQESRFFG